MLFLSLSCLTATQFKAIGGEFNYAQVEGGPREVGGLSHFSARETEGEHHTEARDESGQGTAWAAPRSLMGRTGSPHTGPA